MNPEELFEKLMHNKISREEFERLLDGFDDEDVRARYEVFLQNEFEKEVEKHFAEESGKVDSGHRKLKITKKYQPKRKRGKGGKNFPIAAVITVFIGLLFSALFIISQFKSGSATTQVAKSTITPQIISKTTPKGRKFRMTLEDGTFVHLNSVSSITYPNKFENGSRDIEIVGEAYFKVEKDLKRPFNIKVKDYIVQVLGTSFNVQAYEGEDDFAITVESGIVKVLLDEKGSNTALLEKDQKLIFNPTSNVTEIIDVIYEDEISWRNGMLKFDSTPLTDVVKTIDRWYGVNVILEGSGLENKTFTGTHQNKSLRAVIETITFATRTSYVIKDNHIIIKN